MSKLWLLTKKNLQLLIRSKSSALIVVFAPLLTILILGLSFNNSAKYGINIGVYANSFTEDVNSFVATLQESEFKIVKYDTSLNDCVEDLKYGFVHTCISLPESFKIESNAPREMTFYVDPSRINLVWMVQETVQKKLNLKSQQISETLAKDLLSRLTETKVKVGEEKSTLSVVKEKNDAASQTTETAKSSLVGIDVNPPTSVYDLAVLSTFQEGISSKLSEGKSALLSAQGALSSINTSSSAKSKVSNFLAEAEVQLIAAEDMLGNTSSSGSFMAVSSLVETMNADLSLAKDKLNSAKEKITSTSTSLTNVQSTLGEGLLSLEKAQQNLVAMSDLLEGQKVTEAGVISNPLNIKIEKVTPERTYLNYLFSGLLVLVVMFSSLLLGTTLVMMEKNSPAFLRNFFVPIKKVTFIFSTYLTNLIFILIQVVIILGISLAFLPATYPLLPKVALILFLTASVFTFLGMAIGYVFVSEETGILASISTGSLLLFVSGLILPLESMSPLFRTITSFNPFVIAERLVREVFIFNASFSTLWMDLLILFGYALVLFLLVLIVESFLHQQLAEKFLYHYHHLHREKEKKEA